MQAMPGVGRCSPVRRRRCPSSRRSTSCCRRRTARSGRASRRRTCSCGASVHGPPVRPAPSGMSSPARRGAIGRAPSAATVLPSSQASPGSTLPLPQTQMRVHRRRHRGRCSRARSCRCPSSRRPVWRSRRRILRHCPVARRRRRRTRPWCRAARAADRSSPLRAGTSRCSRRRSRWPRRRCRRRRIARQH